MKIVFVISSMGSGGAERVISNMANYWAGNSWSVTLITLEEKNKYFYNLDKRISKVALCLVGQSTSTPDAVINNIRRILALRSAIKFSRPDAVISFMDRTNVLTIMATLFTGTPVIISERTNPNYHDIGKGWKALRRWLYKKADALVVQTQDVLQWAINTVGKEKAFVIPNCISLYLNNNPNNKGKQFRHPFILAMGRLTPEKGFDLLVSAFAKICLNHPEWLLVILGEGNERLLLEAKVKELGIEDRVYLLGTHPNPVEIMTQAKIFVLSSRYEGFPNALLEAMASGLPVISFDCPSGPREIIRHEIDGILVPPEDVFALAAAMNDLIINPEKRERLASRAIDIVDRFAEDCVMSKWENLVLKVAKN